MTCNIKEEEGEDTMGEVITSILTDNSARSVAAVKQTLMQKADHANAWFSEA